MTGSELLVRGVRALGAAGVADAAQDARRLLAHALDVPTGRLTLVLPDPVTAAQAAAFDGLIARRGTHVPVSHLTGRRMFWGRDFRVTSDVLDPRPETETLIAAALERPFARVLDLGTGSGCILLTLIAETSGTRGVGIDLSAPALDVARHNGAALRLADRITLLHGSWYAPLDAAARFDLIVANPPYIAAHEMSALAPDVRLHEPQMALSDGADGLSAYRAILSAAPAHLSPGGRILVEIGPTQGRAVADMMAAAGLDHIAVLPDLDGRNRVVRGRMPPS